MNEISESRAVRIAAIGTAVPATAMSQSESEAVLLEHYGDDLSPRVLSILRKAFAHPSIRKRHLAVQYPEQVIDEDPDVRIERFVRAAVDLSAEASRNVLGRIGVSPDEISALVVNTCTGYVCPGISTYLLAELGIPPATPVYDLVGHGCGGAIPNLELAARLLDDERGAVLSVAVEICTATFQMGNDLGLIVSNAIFADGAGAAVLWRRIPGLTLVDSARHYAPEHREEIRYVYRNGQLHNQLAAELPATLRTIVPQVVNDLLARNGLEIAEVRHWAIHPGGAKVVDAVQEGLGISDDEVRVTREILAEFGNMSSPTVLFGMQRIMSNGVQPGEWCVMVGMGAGLSVHACLLRG